MKYAGTILIISGIIFVLIGGFMYFGGGISWFGRLPGDIRIVRPGYSLYFPITTCIIMSIIASLIFYLIKTFR